MIGRLRRFLAGSGLGPMLANAVAGSALLRVLGMAFGFLVGVQLARGLGAEGYGLYGVAMSIVAVLTVIPEFGLPQLVLREVAAAEAECDWQRLRGILRWSNRRVLLLSLGIAISAATWLLIFETADSRLFGPLMFGVLLIPIAALGRLNGAALRGLHHTVIGQVPSEVLRPAAFSALLALVPFVSGAKLDPSTAMCLQAVAAIPALIFAVVMLRYRLPEPARQATPVVAAARWWGSAFPMALTEGARILQGHLMILVLGLLTTAGAVGSYRVASSIYHLVVMPVSLINVVIMSLISRLYVQRDRRRLQRMLSWVATAMLVGVVALSLPFLVAGERLLSWVFGPDFASSNAPLNVLCFGGIIDAGFGASAALLNMAGQERRVTRAFMISLLVLALLAPPLILVADELGAAWASVGSVLVWNLSMWRDAHRILGFRTSVVSFFRNQNAI